MYGRQDDSRGEEPVTSSVGGLPPSVLLLEAEQRIGGRTRTVKVGGHSVDEGAAWIHGIEGNPLLADGIINLEEVVPTARRNIWFHGPLPDDSSNFVLAPEDQATWANSMRNILNFVSPGDGVKDVDRSTLDVLDRRRLSGFELWFGAPVEILNLVDLSLESEVGDFPGPHAVVQGGMELVATRLAQKAKELGVCIRLGACVSALEENDACVEIRLACGRQVKARWVVCTVSLGALQVGQIAFVPSLPPNLTGAIARLRMSVYCKCVLVVDETLAAGLTTWTWTESMLFPLAFSYFRVTGKPVVVCTSVDPVVDAMDDGLLTQEAAHAMGLDLAEVLASHVTR